jgi:hypothetical protein
MASSADLVRCKIRGLHNPTVVAPRVSGELLSGIRSRTTRQIQRETAPSTGLAANGNRSIHRCHQQARQDQSYAGPLDLRTLAQAVEWLEQTLHLIAGQAATLVFDIDHHPIDPLSRSF